MNSSSGGGYGNFTAFGLPATSNLFTVNGNDEMDPYLNRWPAAASPVVPSSTCFASSSSSLRDAAGSASQRSTATLERPNGLLRAFKDAGGDRDADRG